MDPYRPSIDPAADNHAVVQRAIDAAHDAGGGTVELAPGPCPLARPLVLRSNVTVRGAGMVATVLRSPGGPVVTASSILRGATLEELTIAGDAGWDLDDRDGPPRSGPSDRAADAAIDLGAGASFCFLRRLRLSDVAGPGVRVAGGPVDHLYLEHVVIEGCGGDGIVLAPEGEAEGVFLTEVSVRSFGLGDLGGRAGVRTGGRVFISQLHVQPIVAGAIGLALEAGSDHTVASNLFFGTAGGVARSTGPDVPPATIEAELIRDLHDRRLARTFP